jgi:nitrate/nitrite-specific signal transduction histidine kinase
MQTQNGGLGLGIMQERAASIRAEFEVESQPGRGTQVSVIWKEPTQKEHDV